MAEDGWTGGAAYERYMGRWSRPMAERYLDWLSPPEGADWIEAGCGSGALTEAVLARCAPRSILATDPSLPFVEHARSLVRDPRVRFERAGADAIPAGAPAGLAVSGLVMNFVPDPAAAIAAMSDRLVRGGTLSFYVWDYPSGGLAFVDAYWSEAARIDPEAARLDEARRFGSCTRAGLARLAAQGGLRQVSVEPIEIETVFDDFEDYWDPFAAGVGPAPAHLVSLAPERRDALRAALRARLGPAPIRLPARAWAVRGLA